MFRDTSAWPPPPGGDDPPPREPPRRLTPREERVVMRGVGLLLLAMFVGPLAGSSVIAAAVAVARAVAG